ncbi:hypothetical protein CRUP_031254 [Coryphaenoides rupestris]|nr:hypothetical protein CRUP_031254 [Coryphaenoides rupestris]
MAALNILKLLSESDQQPSERTGNGPISGVASRTWRATRSSSRPTPAPWHRRWTAARRPRRGV